MIAVGEISAQSLKPVGGQPATVNPNANAKPANVPTYPNAMDVDNLNRGRRPKGDGKGKKGRAVGNS